MQAVFRGKSRLVLGRERDDASQTGVEVDVQAGDVIVVPAGVSHRSVSSEGDYRYIGVYPEVSSAISIKASFVDKAQEAPKWRNNLCEGEEDMDALRHEIDAVAVPDHDPVFGKDGPLVELWKSAKHSQQKRRRQSRL